MHRENAEFFMPQTDSFQAELPTSAGVKHQTVRILNKSKSISNLNELCTKHASRLTQHNFCPLQNKERPLISLSFPEGINENIPRNSKSKVTTKNPRNRQLFSPLLQRRSLHQPNVTNTSSFRPFMQPSLQHLPDKQNQTISLWKCASKKTGFKTSDLNTDRSYKKFPNVSSNDSKISCVRWEKRRSALAEPERMCLPQDVRERIETDVLTRKLSMRKRLSNYFVAKFNLDKEEDLN